MHEAVICTPLRAAIAREAGGLAQLLPEEFGGQVVQAVVERSGLDPSLIEDVVVGNQFSTARMARHCALLGGLPVEVPGVTVSRACGSGLQAIVGAAQAIQTGANELMLAGGVESYTRAPYLLDKPTEAFQRQPPKFVGAETRGNFGHPELGLDTPMALTAENVAEAYAVSRQAQDAFALESQRRAARALERGLFEPEIVPIQVPRRRAEPATFVTDECPRPDTTAEALARLPAAFRQGGTVTAGNACKRADGAAMMLVTSPERARALGLRPLARLIASAQVGLHPNLMGMGPVPAVRKVLDRAGLSLDEIELIELNEAFAAQAVAVIRELGLDTERVNPNGGAIAFGHPTGATGAILTTKLLYELERQQARYGLVTMCIGGGMGLAAIFERLET